MGSGGTKARGIGVALLAVSLLLGSAVGVAPASASPRAWLPSAEWIPQHLNQTGFGFSIAVSGRTAVVGAPFETVHGKSSGEVFVYERRPTGWVQRTVLRPPSGVDGEEYGWAVAVDGESIVVSAPGFGTQRFGATYVYARMGSAWVQQAELRPPGTPNADEYGINVAIAGPVVMVGAYAAKVGDLGAAGVTYVYDDGAGGWVQTQALSASDPQVNAWFGTSIALSGSTAVIGAPYGAGTVGSVYVFANVGGVWSQTQELTASDPQTDSAFGSPIEVSGDEMLIGSLFREVGGEAKAGAAYVFGDNGGSWSQQQELSAPEPSENAIFGVGALDGGRMVVAAPGWAGMNDAPGVAYAYRETARGWRTSTTLAASDGGAGDEFGSALAMSGSNLLITAPSHTSDAEAFGAAYLETRAR